MLNAKAIGELLSRNRDERLCRRWYLMTPNGTLLSYSVPTDINDLRRQAAMAAISWQEYQQQHGPDQDEDEFHGEMGEDVEQSSPLHVLTIESECSNILMRSIQKQLLLVLEGGVPPTPKRAGFVKRITAEGTDGTAWKTVANDSSTSESTCSSVAHGGSGNNLKVSASVLKLQREKLDRLAEAMVADFEQTGFHMPEEACSTLF